MESHPEQCPNCSNELINLNSGKILCRACGWSNRSEKIMDKSKIKGLTIEKILSVVNTGLLVSILITLIFLFFENRSRWEYQTIELTAKESDTAFSDNEKALSYKTIPDISSKISEMGQERWELVSSYLENETAYPNFGNNEYVTGIQPNVRPQKLVLIFKRPKGFF